MTMLSSVEVLKVVCRSFFEHDRKAFGLKKINIFA
jgi:hypothetical protein